jgi:hypothetical protein
VRPHRGWSPPRGQTSGCPTPDRTESTPNIFRPTLTGIRRASPKSSGLVGAGVFSGELAKNGVPGHAEMPFPEQAGGLTAAESPSSLPPPCRTLWFSRPPGPRHTPGMVSQVPRSNAASRRIETFRFRSILPLDHTVSAPYYGSEVLWQVVRHSGWCQGPSTRRNMCGGIGSWSATQSSQRIPFSPHAALR